MLSYGVKLSVNILLFVGGGGAMGADCCKSTIDFVPAIDNLFWGIVPSTYFVRDIPMVRVTLFLS